MDRDLCHLLNKSIDKLTERFVEKYFKDEKVDIHFVEDSMSDELNYNVFINDYYFSIQDIYYALRYDIPFDIIDQRYTDSTDIIG